MLNQNRILVADDDPEMIKQLLQILTKENYQVFTCLDGDQVLKLSKEKLPDLILLDWVMPKKTGIEAIMALKGDSRTYEIPIIMVTAQSTPNDLEHALNIGADDFIKKPFSKIELLSRINKQLKQQKLVQEVQNLKLSQMYSLNQNLSTELSSKAKTLNNIQAENVLKENILEKVHSKIGQIDKIYSGVKELLEEVEELLEKSVSLSEEFENESTENSKFNMFLKQKYPPLTESELRICSIVLFGLKNNEIAEKLFVSVRTVENHRYHIAKKLELPNGVTLKEFLRHLEKEFLFNED